MGHRGRQNCGKFIALSAPPSDHKLLMTWYCTAGANPRGLSYYISRVQPRRPSASYCGHQLAQILVRNMAKSAVNTNNTVVAERDVPTLSRRPQVLWNEGHRARTTACGRRVTVILALPPHTRRAPILHADRYPFTSICRNDILANPETNFQNLRSVGFRRVSRGHLRESTFA